MNLTLKVKLDPTQEQSDALKRTMTRFNAACNEISEAAFGIKSASKYRLQNIVYYKIRKKYGLPAQLAIRAISKVCEAYKRDKSIKPVFNPLGAVIYDQRILSWKGLDRASIVTLDGRTVIPIVMSAYHKSRLDRIRGQADLIFQNGVFYLCVIVDVPEPEKIKTTGTLGIDLGIVNLAVDSDGKSYSGERIKVARRRCRKIRARLQSVGTRSAKKHLKKMSGKEARFQRDINHCISKDIVAKAKDTRRRIALENIKGIRNGTTVRRAQRYDHNSWSFYQLRTFIEYKAVLDGVPVMAVDPRGTSHTCPKCGDEHKNNRPNRDSFVCSRCGFAGFADHIAAMNIAARAAVNQPIVSGECLHFASPSVTSPRALAVGS